MTGGKQEKPQSGWPVSGLRFEPESSRLQGRTPQRAESDAVVWRCNKLYAKMACPRHLFSAWAAS